MVLDLVTEEYAWWQEHRAPEHTVAGDYLSLWNYPVGRAELSDAHKAAIRNFLAVQLLGGPRRAAQFELSVRGHASPSGESSRNDQLSLQRAQRVRDYLTMLGFERITLGSAGADEPVDGDRSGLGLARDRRTTILRFAPTPPPPSGGVGPFIDGPPPPPPTPPGPGSAIPDPVKGVQTEVKGKYGPVPIVTAGPVLVDASFSGTFKVVSVTDQQGAVVVGLMADPSGKISGGKFETELNRSIKLKFAVEPPKGDAGGAVLKGGLQFSGVMGKPEVGVQPGLKFTYIKFTLAEVVIYKEPDNPDSRVTFTGDLQFDLGPGPSTLQRLNDLEASLGGSTAAEGFTVAELEAAGIGGGGIVGALAAVGGAIAVVVAINGGVIYAVQEAKDEADRYTALLARRDGAAARVAWAIVGDAEVQYLERERQWAVGARSSEMLDAFREGRKEVERLLSGDESEQAATAAAWKARFDEHDTKDFAAIRQRVYVAIGGIERDENAGERLAAASP